MKKLLLLLAVILAFTFTAFAQGTETSGSTQTTTTKTKKMHAKVNKESTLTGCISAQPGANGDYTLTNGRYKKGVELTPSGKVKDHAGHQVQLKGEWAKAETPGGGTAASMKSFEVDSVKHISDTCKEAPGGGTTGTAHKGAKKSKAKSSSSGS
jgi:hypothetical protein